MNLELIRGASPGAIRAMLPGFLAEFIADSRVAARSGERTAEVIDGFDEEAFA
jgi:hypothetical protein